MIGAEGASSSKKARISENPVSKNRPYFALVVDDDPMIRRIHSMILKSVGFKVEVAENGKEAVDLFRTGAKFHIVFIDMEMPVMDGIEATKAMRAMKVESKIVGVTSRNSETEREVFMQAGLDLCYTKPLTMAKIVPLLEELQKN
ncbi:two-component response regulator ARR22 [Citrus sinensis]|nr:two-component response regulator ARR22 [Citrus sinensis]